MVKVEDGTFIQKLVKVDRPSLFPPPPRFIIIRL